MTEGFYVVSYERDRNRTTDIRFLNQEVAQQASRFHSSFPQYQRTPLERLKNLAEVLGALPYLYDSPENPVS